MNPCALTLVYLTFLSHHDMRSEAFTVKRGYVPGTRFMTKGGGKYSVSCMCSMKSFEESGPNIGPLTV